MMSRQHAQHTPTDSTTRRRPVGGAALRVCAPIGVNAAFVADVSALRQDAARVGVAARLQRVSLRLLPKLGRRLKLGAVLLAVVAAVLLANLSVAPRTDAPVGSAPVAQAAFPFDDCGFMQFACDAIEASINGVSQLISKGLELIVGDAINPNNFCDRTEMRPDRPDTGFSGFVLGAAQNRSEFFESYNTNAGTTWSRYGAAGTEWNTYFLDCLSTANIVNYAADAVFGFSKIVSVIAIVVFQQTFNSGMLNIFLGGSPPPVQEIIDSLEAQIYLNLAALAIVIGALVMAYRAIIKGFGLADFLSKFLVMVAVSGFAVVFFNNAIPWIKWGNEQVNELTNTVITALRGNECRNAEGKTITLKPVDCTAESIYNTLVYVPWANGEVGSLSSTNNRGDTAEEKRKLAARILDQQAFTWADVAGVDFDIVGRDTETEEDSFGGGVNEALLDKAKKKLEDRDTMVIKDWGAKVRPEVEDDGNPATPLPPPNPADPQQWPELNPDGTEGYSSVFTMKQSQSIWQMWSGGQGGERFAIAVMAVIGALTFGLMLISIAVAYLVLQIATVMFALVAPLAFLVALVPVYGMRVFLRWAELFLGTFIKRVAMAVFVALLLTLYQVILDTDGVPWWLQMVLILAIAIGGASYRKKLTSLSTLGFGGGSGLGLGSSAAKVAAVQSTWRENRWMSPLDRVITAGRAGAHAGSGGSGVRSGNLVNQSSQAYNRQQAAAARGAGRSGAYQGYAPASGGRQYGSYPVGGPAGPRGYQPTGGAYDDRRLQRQVDRLEGDVRAVGRSGPARGTARPAASSRGTYEPHVPDSGIQRVEVIPHHDPLRGAHPPPVASSRGRRPRSGDRGMGRGGSGGGFGGDDG